MKKILIVSHALELGGAERSLIGLLDAIDKKEYKVDLFLLRHEGELLSFIPEGVNLLPEIPAYTVLACPMVQTLKEGQDVYKRQIPWIPRRSETILCHGRLCRAPKLS